MSPENSMVGAEKKRTYRFWVDSSSPFDSVIVLTKEVILVANPAQGEQREQLRKALEAEEPLQEIVPKDSKVIPLSALQSVKSNKHNDLVWLTWLHGKEKKFDNISMPTREDRDSFFDALRTILEPGFSFDVKEHTRIGTAVKPIVGAIVVAGVTWVCYAAAVDLASRGAVDVHGRHRGIKRLVVWTLDLLGPTGVVVVGTLVVLCMFWWLVARVKTPPVMMTLTRAK